MYESVDQFRETLETHLPNWSAAENGDLTYKLEANRRSIDVVFPARMKVVNPIDLRIKQMGRNFRLKLQEL